MNKHQAYPILCSVKCESSLQQLVGSTTDPHPHWLPLGSSMAACAAHGFLALPLRWFLRGWTAQGSLTTHVEIWLRVSLWKGSSLGLRALKSAVVVEGTLVCNIVSIPSSDNGISLRKCLKTFIFGLSTKSWEQEVPSWWLSVHISMEHGSFKMLQEKNPIQ